MKQSSSRMPSQPTDQPSNAIHRLSEVLPRFESLTASSAANQAKTEYRRGEFLEQLVSQKYPAVVAEEHIQFIRDSFTSFNDQIKKLHTDVPRVIQRLRRSARIGNIDNDTNAETDGEMAMDVDDRKDSDYNEDCGVISHQLTAEEEAEDEERWLQAVNALPKETTMTKYFIEMGYQMPPSPPKEESKVQDQQELQLPRRKTHSKKWVPSLIKNNKRASLPPACTEQRFDDASLHNTVPNQNADKTGNLAWPREPSHSSSSMPPLKRAKTVFSSSGRSNFGAKQPPRCASCVQMKKNCDRKTPCGRCSSMRDYKVCIPYWRDLQRNLEAEQ
ncbi:uncharacterized protein Bfra_011512ia [Botrytis fragariae]|uniref:Zn(2)-C6 fungal-type domain-containing protein n=1 Tax=Botrytis fragariae TaxID=1964551 RepID=A0A8H6AYB2_9HELO|nr:uncharacterized protein Bfra_011512ia [Botrytis fragariae]KAF5875749.1 hypothetical protein Bfra_011512ia [Botrytis fragariae]